MSNNRFRDAMGQIDDHLLERCEAYEQKLTKKKRIRLWGTVTAAACLTVMIGVSLFMSRNEPASLFTANDIAALFQRGDGLMSDGTSITVYAPNENALGLLPVPHTNAIPLFQCVSPEETSNEESIREFADGILSGVAQAFGETVPEFAVDIFEKSARLETEIGGHSISVYQYGYLNSFGISRCSLHSAKATTTVINGHKVQIDQTQTDEEIIAGLSDIHQILQDIFEEENKEIKNAIIGQKPFEAAFQKLYGIFVFRIGEV